MIAASRRRHHWLSFRAIRVCAGFAAAFGFGCHSGAASIETYFEVSAPRAIELDSTELLGFSRTPWSGMMRLPDARERGVISVDSLRAGVIRRIHGAGGASGSAVLSAVVVRTSLERFQIPRRILDVPYWTAIMHRAAAQSGDSWAIATNPVYPIYLIRGDVVRDSLVHPPPSWKSPREPRLGEFMPWDSAAWRKYKENLTLITGLAIVADSVLLVNHGTYTPTEQAPHLIKHTVFDLYINKTRVLSDMPSPGEILAYSKGSIFFIARDGPDGAEPRVIEYAWRR